MRVAEFVGWVLTLLSVLMEGLVAVIAAIGFWDQVSETYLVDLFRILEALRRRVLPGLSLTSIRTAVSEQLSLYGPSQASWSITSRLNSPRGFGGY